MATPSIPPPSGHPGPNQQSIPRPSGVSYNSSYSGSSLHRDALSYRPPARVDVGSIKQELHDTLGENGLPYWKALNGYLLGQIGKLEMEGMVKSWLKGKVELHNRLLVSLLHNASLPTHAIAPSSPLTNRKRKRLLPDDPEFDIDDTVIETKSRIQHWISGLHGKERGRVRRAWMRTLQNEEESKEKEGEDMWNIEKRKLGMQMQAGNNMPPLAGTSRLLPSSAQLAHRLSQLAKGYDLNISPEAQSDIGEFLAVGMDAHLSDILHAHVHLTGRDRGENKTIRVPPGTQPDEEADGIKLEETDGEVPKPDIETLRSLFTLNPSIHSVTSPALYRLASGVTLAEMEINSPPVKAESSGALGRAHNEIKREKVDDRINRYLDNGMIKVDATKDDKKEKKHSLHWKYEDPALILESFLG